LPVRTKPAVTVNVVEPLVAPDVAWIVVVPCATPVAKPVALIVATFVADELHVAVALRSCVELSLYVPVAVKCCVLPIAIDGFAGVTARDTNVAAVTVRGVLPLIDPEVAVIVVLPCATLVAKSVALIIATFVADELHVTLAVRFCVEPSLYVPVAVNCCV
jgi:hypothetical protein